MHILLLTHYYEPDSGAAAVRLSRLARILHERGHRVTVLTTLPHYPQGRIAEGYRGKPLVVETRDGILILRAWLWATANPRISRRLISQLSFMLSAALHGLGLPRPDVMLIEAQPVFTSLAGVFISQILRVPYVLNVSDLWPEHLVSVGALTETHPVYRAARQVVNFSYRRSAGIVAMSPAWAQTIRRYIDDPEKLHVIYNGVDLAGFRPDLDSASFRQKYDLGEQRLVTFLGTFATQYDFNLMLDIAKRLRQWQGVSVLLVGDGSQSQVVKTRLAQGDLPNVKLIDWMPHELMPEVWAASYLTYWAMRDEPLYHGTIPAKLYEALASGVPVAAAMSGEGAAFVARSQAGIVVSPGDGDALYDAIKQLLDDPAKRDDISRAARAYAEQHLDPANVASAYEAVLEGVLPPR